jgi:hypothetical protein
MTPTELRIALFRGGFAPLPLQGKNPSVNGKDWRQKRLDTNETEIKLWENIFEYATNTGILTRSTPALDILDPIAADAIEQLVRDRYEDHGRVLPRIGRAPNRAILFRTDSPFAKIAVKLIAPDGSQQKIEFLCDGQQLVVNGVHPPMPQPPRSAPPGASSNRWRHTKRRSNAAPSSANGPVTASWWSTITTAKPTAKTARDSASIPPNGQEQK